MFWHVKAFLPIYLAETDGSGNIEAYYVYGLVVLYPESSLIILHQYYHYDSGEARLHYQCYGNHY